jgi:uncharacterized protein (DUF2062 family)
MTGFFRRRLWRPFGDLLRQGLSPGKLAASVAVGIGLSIFPVFGATTLLCLIAAYLGRLNQPTMQLINYLAGPLQLLLLIPFIRLGEWLFHAPRLPLAAHQIVSHIKADTFGAIRFFWTSTWHAVVAWLLVVPLASLLLTLFLIPLLRRLAPKPLAGEAA